MFTINPQLVAHFIYSALIDTSIVVVHSPSPGLYDLCSISGRTIPATTGFHTLTTRFPRAGTGATRNHEGVHVLAFLSESNTCISATSLPGAIFRGSSSSHYLALPSAQMPSVRTLADLDGISSESTLSMSLVICDIFTGASEAPTPVVGDFRR